VGTITVTIIIITIVTIITIMSTIVTNHDRPSGHRSVHDCVSALASVRPSVLAPKYHKTCATARGAAAAIAPIVCTPSITRFEHQHTHTHTHIHTHTHTHTVGHLNMRVYDREDHTNSNNQDFDKFAALESNSQNSNPNVRASCLLYPVSCLFSATCCLLPSVCCVSPSCALFSDPSDCIQPSCMLLLASERLRTHPVWIYLFVCVSINQLPSLNNSDS
jgi:hypothetical protein